MPRDAHDHRLALTSERAALQTFLDSQRKGLIRKIEGVDDALARQAPTASSLSLLGILKHSVTWEGRWFQVIMAGREVPDGWPEVRTEPHDADMAVDEHDTVAHWLTAYREHIETSNAIAASMDLDAPCARADIIECNERYVLFHMIEETARHAGHADIIRETLDGSRGI
ncbi:DinB family protein [soil metagenome]